MICGKSKPKLDPRTLRLASYLTVRDLPAPPMGRAWHKQLTSIPLHANDRVGDCTIVAQSHLIEMWTSMNGGKSDVTTSDVLANYTGVTGYNPADPATDTGAPMLDALNFWRKNGLGGHKPLAYVKVDWRDAAEVKVAANEFGGLYVGAGLPKTTQKAGDWVAAPLATGLAAPYSRGGHAMALGAYDRSWVTFLTWGGRQRASWRWVWDYVDEAYAIISEDWLKNGTAPNGFDKARLIADLGKLGLL